jgi:hypothetical protein
MDESRDSRLTLQCVYDALAPHSATARTVMGAYADAVSALINAADLLWRANELRFCAALETQAIGIELQARRHLDAIGVREQCRQCGGWLDNCGPALWDQHKKCCPDCSHVAVRHAPVVQ